MSRGAREALAQVDRRGSPRGRYATLVRIVEGDRKVDARCDNISPTGLSVVVAEGIPEGTKAMVRFALPVSDATISLACVVVWEASHCSGGRLIGLHFSHASFEVEQEIRQYVDAVGALPDDAPG